MIDYFFWNTDEFGFHLTNVLLHVGCGVLLYFLLQQLFISILLDRVSSAIRNRAVRQISWIQNIAFLIALVWTVHPVHSAAVDYISGRADSLAFLFACISWLLVLRAHNTSSRIRRSAFYGAAALSALLALTSRESACIWIALFLVYLFVFQKGVAARTKFAILIGIVCVLAAYAGLRTLPTGKLADTAPSAQWSNPVRAVLMLRSLGDYGRIMIFPNNLHMERTVLDPAEWRDHQGWRRSAQIEYLSVFGLAVFLALGFGAIWKGRGQLLRSFGAIWFLLAYLPISNLVDLNATSAEHWLYLPSVGFLIFLAGCALELPHNHQRKAQLVALLAIAALSVRSYVRSSDWVNPEVFYRRSLAAGGKGTTARMGVNLGQVYAARGAYADAEKVFRAILASTPNYPVAQNNLANVLSREGKTAEAEKIFAAIDKASVDTRKEYPRTWIGAVNYAGARYNAKDGEGALTILSKARTSYPETWEIIALEAEILRETQGPEAALQIIEQFAHDHWWHYEANLALGRLYAQKGDIKRAEEAWRHASRLDVHDAEALRGLVLMRMRQNRLAEALQIQRRAVARQPDEPRQYILLSDILEKMGRSEEARATLTKASQLHALAETPLARSL
jgi:Flp pilus assembly protein TadD